MSCEVASWVPAAVATTLRAHEHCSAALLSWLGSIRDDIQEYDALVVTRCESEENITDIEEDTASPSSNSAFDKILSQLGEEIYKLNEYQRKITPNSNVDTCLSKSILDLFEDCLLDMTNSKTTNGVEEDNSAMLESDKVTKSEREVQIKSIKTEVKLINGNMTHEDEECSYIESTPSGISISSNGLMAIGSQDTDGVEAPVLPPRARLKTSSMSSAYDKLESYLKAQSLPEQATGGFNDSDSESTCWSYRQYQMHSHLEDPHSDYAAVWFHTSGYQRSDEILRNIISQQYATESELSFDTANEWPVAQYEVYALQEVGDRCVVKTGSPSPPPVVDMTPGDAVDDGYEPVRDAITDENIYEEIEFPYTDEGYSCGSIEVESCSNSASSDGLGRESPLYANFQDNDAYAMPPDVIAWKNLLRHPFYNDDEEDEWITPEECAVYSRDQRPPPFVIPRIIQYKAPRYDRRPVHNHYPEDITTESPALLKNGRTFERLPDWSPVSERPERSAESPVFQRLNKKLGGSTENLLNKVCRPNYHNLPPSSSGDSLDLEFRQEKPGAGRNFKVQSLIGPSHQRVKSPIPAPRMLLPQSIEAPPVIHEGVMKRTKFAENGKKCKKHWSDCYVTLTPTALVFYKDQKTYIGTKSSKAPGTPPSPSSPRMDLTLPLRNAYAVACFPMHTRRFNRSITVTVNFDVYLLQVDSEDGAKHWLSLIQNVIYRLGPPTMHTTYDSANYQSSNTDIDSVGRTPPVSRNRKGKHKAGGSSNEDLSDTTEVSISTSHVRSILRKFFPKRPAMDVLVTKGIYKDEPVFGCNLEQVCPLTSPRVPEFVIACVKEIEKNEENLMTDGLYRASGNLSQVQKIRLEIDQKHMSVIENYPDIHVLTGSLKLFFRELKEPLIPCKLYDRILSACSIKPREAKVKEFKEIVQALPQCNRETLKYLLEHLQRVTKYSEHNRMHTANLAIVFGPTLLWAPAEQAHNIAIDCIQQNMVVDTLLTEFKGIFAEDNAKGKKKA